MNNRREFIKKAAAGVAFISLPISSFAKKREYSEQLVILHTNDVHSHIEPFPATDKRFPSQGGFAARAAVIQKIRNENKNVLLLDSGDIFQGTPYFNFYGGRLELQLMSKMGYDAAIFGNHEFDNGLEHLADQIQYANFPFIATNYEVTNTPLENKTTPWKVIKKGAIRIGIIGLGIRPDGLIAPSNFGDVKYLDPIKIGDDTAKMLKTKKRCDLVIALSHLGLKMTNSVDDITLAQNTQHIDMILGGHTHTFLEQPVLENNLLNKTVSIHQSGFGGVKMERIKLIFDKSKSDRSTSTSQLTLR